MTDPPPPGMTGQNLTRNFNGHVKSLKKILGESLVYHTRGGQSSFDHAHVESLKKILGENRVKIQHVHGQKMIDPLL